MYCLREIFLNFSKTHLIFFNFSETEVPPVLWGPLRQRSPYIQFLGRSLPIVLLVQFYGEGRGSFPALRSRGGRAIPWSPTSFGITITPNGPPGSLRPARIYRWWVWWQGEVIWISWGAGNFSRSFRVWIFAGWFWKEKK